MLQSVTECYRALQSFRECYRELKSVTESFRVLQSVTEYYKVLQSITKTNLAHLLGPIFGLVLLIPESTKKVRKSLQRVGFKMRLALLKMIGMKTSIVAGNS